MYNGYNKIYWGTIIITFSIKFGSFKVLPSTIGYIVILMGITQLYDNSQIEAFRGARYYALIQTIFTFISEIREFGIVRPWNLFILDEIWIITGFIIQLCLFYKVFEGAILFLKSQNDSVWADVYIKKLRQYLLWSLANTCLISFSLIHGIVPVSIISIIIFIGLSVFVIISTKKLRDMHKRDMDSEELELT